MNDVIRYSFEKVKNTLYRQAYKIQQLMPDKYEVDELVNEVWLRGSIQKVSNIKYVAARSYWDMIDYIRKTEGRNFMRKGEFIPRPRHITNMHSIKNKKYNEETGCDFFHDLAAKEQNYLNLIDDQDEIDYLLRCLPNKKRTILEKYFLEGMTLVDVGKILGFTDVTICGYKKQAIEEIREIHKIDVKEKKKSPPLQEVLPEYVSDYEINNECSINEELILEKDWKE